MTQEVYERAYNRLAGWRERWNKLANKREPGRLQNRQERTEERAAAANNRIGKLIQAYDEERRRPYVSSIKAFVEGHGGSAYRQDIFDELLTPGGTNSRLIGDALAELEQAGALLRETGPCTIHKGPILKLRAA